MKATIKEKKILFNSKNGFFLKYNNEDFKTLDEFIYNEKINTFLKSKDFFYTEDEIESIKIKHLQVLKSKDTFQLIIKSTKDCDFRCTYCYESFSDKKIENIDPIINFIINEYSKFKYKNLILVFFGGEPLLNMKFIIDLSIHVINFCKENNINYNSSIVTNGYNLNKENFEKLIKYIKNYQITVDGCKSIHDTQRIHKKGLETFDTIYKNIDYIHSTNYQYKVILRTNISKKMIGKLDEYYKEINRFFDNNRFIAMFHPVVNFEDLSHAVSDKEVLTEIKKANKYGIKFARLSSYLTLDSSYCYAMKENNYVINTDMTVSKCTDTNDSYSIIGKLKEDGLIEFNEYNNIWKAARLSEKCIDCNTYAGCGGGACPLYYLKHGKSRCAKYKNKEDFQQLLKFDEATNKHDLYIRVKR